MFGRPGQVSQMFEIFVSPGGDKERGMQSTAVGSASQVEITVIGSLENNSKASTDAKDGRGVLSCGGEFRVGMRCF